MTRLRMIVVVRSLMGDWVSCTGPVGVHLVEAGSV